MFLGGLGAALALMHTHPTGEAALALMHTHSHGRLPWLSCMHTHGRLPWLPTPHTHTPVAFGQAGEG